MSDERLHALMTFPSREALLEASRLATSWLTVSDADASRVLQAEHWEHVITYGLPRTSGLAVPVGIADPNLNSETAAVGQRQMEAEGWQIAAAFTTTHPNDREPYLIWKRRR